MSSEQKKNDEGINTGAGCSRPHSTGDPDIYDLCKAAGMPDPEFDFVPNFVCLTIRFRNPITPYVSGGGELNGGVNGGVNALSESLKQLYTLICDSQGLDANQLADRLKRSVPTIEKQLSNLKKHKLITHKGFARTGGYYPVVKK